MVKSAPLRVTHDFPVGSSLVLHGRLRLWHARSNNYSPYTRMAIFFGYTLRWIAIRDDLAAIHASDWFSRLDPVKRQLLGGYGGGDGDHQWGHHPDDTPLYGYLAAHGLLNPDHPPLIP